MQKVLGFFLLRACNCQKLTQLFLLPSEHHEHGGLERDN
jgi:hypothetical protein